MLMGTGSPGGSLHRGRAAHPRRAAPPDRRSLRERRRAPRQPEVPEPAVRPQHVERRRHFQRFTIPFGGSGLRTDGDAGRRQPRHGRRQRRPGTLPLRRRRHRRQRYAIRAQELEPPCGGRPLESPSCTARWWTAFENQGAAAPPGPMHHVMGVAVAGAAAGELALVAIPALEGTAQRGRDRAGPAAHIEPMPSGAWRSTTRPASQATRRAASCPRGCPLLAQSPPGRRREPAAAAAATAAVRCRRDVESDSTRGLDRCLARSGVRCRCRRFRGRRVDVARFRGNAPWRWRPRGSQRPLPRARSPASGRRGCRDRAPPAAALGHPGAQLEPPCGVRADSPRKPSAAGAPAPVPWKRQQSTKLRKLASQPPSAAMHHVPWASQWRELQRAARTGAPGCASRPCEGSPPAATGPGTSRSTCAHPAAPQATADQPRLGVGVATRVRARTTE